MPNAALLALDNINLTLDGKVILNDVSLSVAKDEIVTLVGPNGAGKSTLISIALGLRQADSGRVRRSPDMCIGYVPQSVNRDYTMPVSVKDFILLTKTRPNKTVYNDTIERLSLTAMQDKQISDLSGGELRRVLFARALLNHPDLLVLDEPTAGVDVAGQKNFYHDLNLLRQQYGFSILMVSHDLHLVMSATDRVICLNQHICCQGQPTHVLRDPQYQQLFYCQGDNHQNTSLASSINGESELAFYEHHHDHVHD